MKPRIKLLWDEAAKLESDPSWEGQTRFMEKFAELLMQDMHRKVIASILITDVVITEKGQKPTSEDYIRAINHDFGVD